MLFKHFIQEQEVAIRRRSFTWNPLKLSVKTLICNEIVRWQPASLPKKLFPNGHIFVDAPSVRRRNSTWKVCENYIDFERQIHVEIMTSFGVEISTWIRLCELSLSYSGIMLTQWKFNDIDVITHIGTISFENFATKQINRNKNNFIFFRITLENIIMPIFASK